MPYQSGQRPLMDCLSFLPVTRLTKKQRILGRTYIRLYNYYWVLSFLYECGAIIGRAKRNKLDVLQKLMFSSEGSEPLFFPIELFQEKAKTRLYVYEQRFGKQPNSFSELVFEWELQIATGANLTDCLEALHRGNKKALKPFQKKVHFEIPENVEVSPAGKTQDGIRMFVAEGIGFGSLYPELTDKMSRNYYKSIHIDYDAWADEKKAGYPIPEKPLILSLEEQEELLLQLVGEYTASYYPELLDPLDLRDYQHLEFGRYSDWLKSMVFIHDAVYLGRGYPVTLQKRKQKQQTDF